MVAIFTCCAYPTVARAVASTQNPNTCLVTMELLTLAVLFILSDIVSSRPLKCAADGEAERRPLLEKRDRVAVSQNRAIERRRVREQRAVRDDGRLQELAHIRGVVSPVDAE